MSQAEIQHDLRSDLHFTRLLRNIMIDPDTGINERETAEKIVISFENALEDIIREVVSY